MNPNDYENQLDNMIEDCKYLEGKLDMMDEIYESVINKILDKMLQDNKNAQRQIQYLERNQCECDKEIIG